MRLGFCGSPSFAVPVLDALCDAGHEVGLVVTRADRRRTRGGRPQPTAVKLAAGRLGIPVTHRVAGLLDAQLQAAVVVAYGAMVPAAVLAAMPVLNLHLSLLPRWRGAAPLERAILAGDETTGVCVMALETTLDTGPVYARATTELDDKTLSALRDELVAAGTGLLLGLLACDPASWPAPEPQVGEATYAHKLTDADFELDFSRPASELHRIVRLERARTWADGRRLVVLEADVVEGCRHPAAELHGDVVACGEGGLRLRRVLPEGRRAMSTEDWLRGLRDGAPSTLGPSRAP